MIDEVRIKNFKSIDKLKLPLGQITVLIGANGCGKSNILEAIGMGSAASSFKLENEFLASRGIRVTEPQLMRSAFEDDKGAENIELEFFAKNYSLPISIENKNDAFSKWKIPSILLKEKEEEKWRIILDDNDLNKELIQRFISSTFSLEANKNFPKQELDNFLTYAPENNKIRNFREEAQIEPLGIRGEGLFKLLSVESDEKIADIKEHLKLIDWFKGFKVPERLHQFERRIRIEDRYIHAYQELLDQRSANEGFLFLLFYLTLMVSKYTPSFFAIDNIDNALNPSLCTKLVEVMTKLAKKYNKQVILTTHNPAILDGLNLNDPSQKLFVVFRNALGATRVRAVNKQAQLNGQEPVKLSEAFLRGYIGGLNKNTF